MENATGEVLKPPFLEGGFGLPAVSVQHPGIPQPKPFSKSGGFLLSRSDDVL